MYKVISIQRSGSFAVGWKHSHSHQCGHYGDSVLRFDVDIRGFVFEMGPDGWLCDNNEITSYFVNKYQEVKDFLTCEHIARVAVHDMRVIVQKNKSFPRYIRVSISGIEHSTITVRWAEPPIEAMEQWAILLMS